LRTRNLRFREVKWVREVQILFYPNSFYHSIFTPEIMQKKNGENKEGEGEEKTEGR
jgi:hypothetical protein